jgi:hypothetical protein
MLRFRLRSDKAAAEREALFALAERLPPYLLRDLNLPVEEGFSLSDSIRVRKLPRTPSF